MRRWWVALLVTLSLLAAACSGGDDDDDDSGGTDESEEDGGEAGGDGEGWTILQYQIADTDLEPFLMADVDEMAGVGSNDNLTIRALIDRAADYGDDPVVDLDGWVGGKLVQVNHGELEILEDDLGDVNTGDPAVLQDFIAQGIADNPAAHYAVVLSDHGASWPGVGADESAGHDALSLEEIHDAVQGALEEAGIEKLDLIGFDACLMATYEVASTLAPLADRMVASSELEPGHGWDYAAYQVVADDPDATVDDLGTAIVDGFLAQAEASGTESDVTLSLLDLNQMEAVDAAMADFTAALVERSADVSPAVGRSLAQNPGYGRSPDPSQDTFMTDLGALAAEIGIEALDVSDQADALIRAINDAVVHKISGPAAPDFSGLSVYFPPVTDYFNEDYRGIPETSGGWISFLDAFYGAGDAIPVEEQPTFVGDATITFDEDGLNIEGFFDSAAADNVSTAYIEYGFQNEDGSITYIGDEQAEVSDDGSGLVTGFYDLTTLNLTDQVDTALAYLSLTYDDEQPGFDLSIPLAYFEPGVDITGDDYQDILLEVVVDDEQNVTQETYFAYDDELGSYGEATLEPDGLLVPRVLQYDADGNQTWVPTSDVGLFADLPNILYEFPTLESGTELYIELVVEDFGGNRDSVSAIVTIP